LLFEYDEDERREALLAKPRGRRAELRKYAREVAVARG